MIFVGHDWAEDHHDICVQDETGKVVAKRRLTAGVDGIGKLHELVAAHVDNPADVVIGTETDHGLFVGAMVVAGYQVFAVNPLATSRYRDRHGVSGAKSDPGHAKVLADLVRTDRHNHRTVAGDSEHAEAIKILARAHQNLIWARQRQCASLRSVLREFYPAAIEAFDGELTSGDALSILAKAPTPNAGRRLSTSQIEATLRRGGRKRYVSSKAAEFQKLLRSEHLQAPDEIANAFGASVAAMVSLLNELNHQIASLEQELTKGFDTHADAEIFRSLPGMGSVLGGRILGEFGDDVSRYLDAKARKNYAGTSPITRASGTKRLVLARFTRNRRLADACYWWAFGAIRTSPGARALYDSHRAKGDGHHQALRAVANRLVGILHGCLKHRTLYDEAVAWADSRQAAAA